MKFLLVNKDSTAEIYGHLYKLKAPSNPEAGLKDILVADDGSASELLNRHKGILSSADLDLEKIQKFPETLQTLKDIKPNSTILVLRSGGIGDHIMLLPAIRALKEAFYDRPIRIWVSVQRDMFAIFQDAPYIDRILPLPITLEEFQNADYLVDFSQSIISSAFNEKHPTDYYLDILGIKHVESQYKLPTLNPDNGKNPTIIELINVIRDEHKGRPLILIQWKASVHIRTFPPENLKSLTHNFGEAVFISAHHYTQAEQSNSDIKNADLKVLDISYYIRDLSDFIIAVSLVDGIVSTDSSAYHVAAALDKPTIALFGPIQSDLRTCYYPKTISIDAGYNGKICHSPCWRHKGICPESQSLKTPYSPCLMSIPVDTINYNFKRLFDTYMN